MQIFRNVHCTLNSEFGNYFIRNFGDSTGIDLQVRGSEQQGKEKYEKKFNKDTKKCLKVSQERSE